MPNQAQRLILRGLHVLMRASFSPNEPVAQAKHFAQLQADIGPWLSDYVNVQSLADPEPAGAQLGLATTGALLAELRARAVHTKPGRAFRSGLAAIDGLEGFFSTDVTGGLDYRTVDEWPASKHGTNVQG